MEGNQENIEPIPEIENQLVLEVPGANADPESSTTALTEPVPVFDGRPPSLRRVWIKRFKGFSEFEVELGRFNVLVGANNSGKSTMLQAIDLLYRLLKLHREGGSLPDHGRLLPPSVVPVASMKDLFFKRTTRQANKPVTAEVGAEFTDGSVVEFAIRHLFGAMNSRVQRATGMEADRLSALLSHPAVWVPSAVGIVREEEYRTPARRTSLINAGRHHEVLRNLLVELRREHNDRYDALQSVLQERFGASLDDVQFDEATDEYVRADMSGGAGIQHDLYSAGSGLIQTVQLLAFILVQNPSVVLLDEPDAHLHSSLQRGIVEILERIGREEDFQIIVATHSKEIINFIDPSRLIFVQPGENKAGPMGKEVTPVAVLRSLGAIDNVDAFALLKNRRCLFVEGTSDVAILERFAATFGLHMFGGNDRVVVIPTGGADQFGHVQQLDVFEQLLGAELASLELRDRDSRTADDRAELIDKASRPLIVFELDSIESYLLNPDVVSRVVQEVAAERSQEVEVSSNDVKGMLLSLTEEMKLATIDRSAERYGEYHRRATGQNLSIKQINETARGFVEEHWDDLEGRLKVVSGKKLLGALRNEIQENYKVSFGNERLADGFQADEIPSEIGDALKETAALEAPAPGAD